MLSDMSNDTSFIDVTVDKGHIITIGERLYEQSIELIRELVNNAYDADATRVDVTVSKKEITVADNGQGMDMEGLKQYFNVGSDEKLLNPVSPDSHETGSVNSASANSQAWLPPPVLRSPPKRAISPPVSSLIRLNGLEKKAPGRYLCHAFHMIPSEATAQLSGLWILKGHSDRKT
jgi:hypothetical protein